LYGLTTRTFKLTSSLNVPRDNSNAMLLNNGTVQMAGGETVAGFLSSTELQQADRRSFEIFTPPVPDSWVLDWRQLASCRRHSGGLAAGLSSASGTIAVDM
jgi:hypothetical protein